MLRKTQSDPPVSEHALVPELVILVTSNHPGQPRLLGPPQRPVEDLVAMPALMAVVHGCPGSWVQPGRVCLRLRGGAPDLAEALSRALALAHALEPARRGDTLPG